MRWTYKLPLRLRSLFKRGRIEQELSDELCFHLEKLIDENVAKGMTPEEARYSALRDLGGVEQIKEECREMRRVNYIENFIQDLRYGLRMLAKNPGFTAMAVLTLALGIGVNTTLFTAFDAVALKPLPVREPNSVVRLVRTLASGSVGDVQYNFSYPEYVYYRDHNRVFSGLIAASWPVKVFALLPGEASAGSLVFREPEGIQGQLVSANYFAVLGISTVIGRAFVPEEDQAAGAHPVIVLSYPFWQRRFNSDPQLLGKVVKLNDTQFTVIGVAPRGFIGTANPPMVPDFWAPLTMQAQVSPGEDWLNRPTDYQIQLLGRIAPATVLSQAQAEVTVLAQQFQAAESTSENDKTIAVTLRRATYFGETNDIRFQAFFVLLMVVVGMVLLVACANLANMLLARSAGRQREVGIRLVMGASRGRLVRQWLTESILLALLGGTAGLLLSLLTTTLLRIAIAPVVQELSADPSLIQLSPDFRVFVYTLLVSIASGVAFGLSPALQFSRPSLTTALKEEGTAFSQRVNRSCLRGLFLGGQFAVSMLLLISAGLLVRGLLRSLNAHPGFETRRVFPLGLYNSSDPAKASALATRVIERLRDLPAVKSLGLAYRPPWSGTWTPPVRVEGTKAPPKSLPWQVLANYVSPGYFPTLGIPIVIGRNFTRYEGDTGAPVAIVSESAARRFWPDEDPLGKRLKLDLNFKGNWAEFEVVGVAKDVRTANLSRVDPGYVYLATDATKLKEYALLFQTHGDTAAALASVRTALEGLDRIQFPPGLQLNSLEQGAMRLQRVIPHAIAYFAMSLSVLALLLALVGVYGVMSYLVSQRTHEIGVRMALGATAPDILRWVVRQGMRAAVIGAVIGLTCSIGVAMALRAVLVFPGSPDLLFGVSALDPVIFVGSPCFLATAVLIACYIPARRATKVDPMAALRYE
jgi:putative ABC transport system permease protein